MASDTSSHPSPLDAFIHDLRSSLAKDEEDLVPALGPCPLDLEESYLDIPLADGNQVRAKVWRPASSSSRAPRPLILLFHGGGFVAGSCEQMTRPGRELAGEFGAVLVSAEYRLVPEHKFPQSALDSLDIATWISQNAVDKLGADPSTGFIVGGNSAGAQIAAVVTSEARSRNLQFPITGCFLSIPWLFVPAIVPEKYRPLYTSRDKATPRHRENVDHMIKATQSDVLSPLFNPVNGSSVLAGLPPTYLQVGGKDGLRDDGVVYEMLLRDAGVETKLDSHPEIGHESWSIWTDETTASGRLLKEKTIHGVRWLLNGPREK